MPDKSALQAGIELVAGIRKDLGSARTALEGRHNALTEIAKRVEGLVGGSATGNDRQIVTQLMAGADEIRKCDVHAVAAWRHIDRIKGDLEDKLKSR